MDVQQLRYLLVIAEEGQISKAAKKLFLSQPALSQYLSKLEKELGTKLVLPVNNQLVLTETGKVYADGAREMIAVYEKAMEKLNDIAENRSPSIRIIVSQQALPLLSEAIKCFGETHLDISIDIQYASGTIAKEYLDYEQCHLAIIDTELHAKASPPLIPLYQEEIVLIAPAGDTIPDLADLGGTQFILFKENSYFSELQKAAIKAFPQPPKILCEISDFRSALQMVSAGFGVAFIPRRLVMNNPAYRTLSLDPPGLYQMAVTYKAGSGLSRRAQSLVQDLVESCAGLPGI